ncbi:MAG: SLBB domain-containing protein [Armatimonadetes bacterium]|nr:SLBB domain-containing protein [Armatimonadota bacterium]
MNVRHGKCAIGGRLAMRIVGFGLVFLLLATSAIAAVTDEADLRRSNWPIPPTALIRRNSEQEAGQEKTATSRGAMPLVTEAEKVRLAEETLQNRFLPIKQAVENLEKRVEEMRRMTESPPRWDIERVEQDKNLIAQELDKLIATELSPLGEIQRNDLRDRLFAIELSMEIAKRRWGGTWTVFGMDFFTSAPPPPTIEQRPTPPNYRLRIGDKLRIAVVSSLGHEKEYQPVVDTSGNIHIPAAGTVKAVRKTCEQLRREIVSKIGVRFRQLRVTVAVESMATLLVQVAGDVARPGTYMLSGMPTVMSALYQAGGPTKSGTFRRVKLTRAGEPERIIDLYDFLMKGNRVQDLPLEDGDLVFVPPVGHTIVVEGDVVRPARYEPNFPLTLGDALKMAGGVRATGLHTVQVERVVNNEYRVLLNEPITTNGGQSNFAIMPGDTITVTSVRPDRTNQVSISGPVRAPGFYGFTEDMRVSDLVKLAQGLDPNQEVYGGKADILRLDPMSGSKILTFSLDKALAGDPEHDLKLAKLDRVFIYQPDQVVFRPRVVTVQGAVANPGAYKRTDGMRVSDAVAAAGGLLPEAYLARADLIRRASDGSSEIIRVDLEKAMSGDPTENLELRDRDELTICTHSEVQWTSRLVRVEGAVQRPGVYERSNNMRVSDLLFACGGLLPEAGDTCEIGRQGQAGESKIIRINNIRSLTPQSPDDLVLEDRDVVTIPALNPSLRAAEVVVITGEVARPGPYALTGRNDRLIDLIARAGGLTDLADTRGMLFLRQKESFENSQQERDVDIILKKTRAFTDKQFLTQLAKLGVGLPGQIIQAVQQSTELAKPSEVVEEERLSKEVTTPGSETLPEPKVLERPVYAGEPRRTKTDSVSGASFSVNAKAPSALLRPPLESGLLAQTEVQSETALGPKIAELERNRKSGFEGRFELALLENSTRISVDLNKAFQDPNSADNIPLRNGDQIFIPRITNIVEVVGAVLHPHRFAAKGGNSVDYYIRRSGGYAPDAAKGSVVVVRSNGDALPANEVHSVEPGDTIVVPTTGLIDIAKKWERIGSVTKVLTDVLSSVYILTRF